MRRLHLMVLILLFQSGFGYSQSAIKHFIFFSQDREGIHDSAFFLNPGISGAQITYPWKKLEPTKDVYDFGMIREDLEFLKAKRKKLFIQIQDVTFDSNLLAVPQYILGKEKYHGGVNTQYDFIDGDEKKPVKAGWVARRWDSAVATRFHNLLIALGRAFDGEIEGINLPETSVEFGSGKDLYPPGFDDENYCQAILNNMKILKRSFPKSQTIQYANFMPGSTLPRDGKYYLEKIYAFAEKIGVGVGGPDILVYRKYQMANSYGLIRSAHGKTTTGAAVQDGNYGIINPMTGKKVTVPEILDFAQNYLRLNYIFWCTEEPYYTSQVLPLIKKEQQQQDQ